MISPITSVNYSFRKAARDDYLCGSVPTGLHLLPEGETNSGERIYTLAKNIGLSFFIRVIYRRHTRSMGRHCPGAMSTFPGTPRKRMSSSPLPPRSTVRSLYRSCRLSCRRRLRYPCRGLRRPTSFLKRRMRSTVRNRFDVPFPSNIRRLSHLASTPLLLWSTPLLP